MTNKTYLMRALKFYFLVIISMFFIQCKKDDSTTNKEIVRITTNKSIYTINEKISVEIKNISTDTLKLHFQCRGDGYCAIEKIGKMYNNNWIIQDNINVCLWIVLADYWGKFSPNQIVNDEITLQEAGKYRLLSGFIYKNDTIHFSSNDFIVE
jgi:hypothetical protein